MTEQYEKAMELWEVPREFYEAAAPMYRDYEIQLAVKMEKNQVSGEEICVWLKELGYEEPEKLLWESYSRNVLVKTRRIQRITELLLFMTDTLILPSMNRRHTENTVRKRYAD